MAGGGAERVTLTLLNYFSSQGHEVDLVLCQAQGELLDLVPPQIQIVELKARKMRQALWPLVRYLRKRRPDAMQVSMWPLTVIAVAARVLARTRTRLMVVDHAALSRQYRRGMKRQSLRWTIRLLYPLANVRALVSSAAADDLARLSGIRRESIDVVHNPLQLGQISGTSEAVEALWGDADERILSVGTLKEQKNHALLLDAFALLIRKRPSARLMIVGEGPLRLELESRAASLGIPDHVLMPGFALDPAPYYSSAHLFVLSSDYEGLPVVLVEALNAGLRVVSTDCLSGPREILDNGRYGALVPCSDPEALSQAMDGALAAPVHPETLRKRAIELSGPGPVSRYLELMLGPQGSSRTRANRITSTAARRSLR
jgi:glycosyltransferase involved in cell wall biosynthesis